ELGRFPRPVDAFDDDQLDRVGMWGSQGVHKQSYPLIGLKEMSRWNRSSKRSHFRLAAQISRAGSPRISRFTRTFFPPGRQRTDDTTVLWLRSNPSAIRRNAAPTRTIRLALYESLLNCS